MDMITLVYPANIQGTGYYQIKCITGNLWYLSIPRESCRRHSIDQAASLKNLLSLYLVHKCSSVTCTVNFSVIFGLSLLCLLCCCFFIFVSKVVWFAHEKHKNIKSMHSMRKPSIWLTVFQYGVSFRGFQGGEGLTMETSIYQQFNTKCGDASSPVADEIHWQLTLTAVRKLIKSIHHKSW